MSDGEVLDSHHHLWDTRELEYTLFREVRELKRPYTLAEFEREVPWRAAATSICVEAASAGADGRRETDWLLRETEGSIRVRALVAWAPLDKPDHEQHLDWLVARTGTPIVGVRRSFEFEPPDFPANPAVIAGARTAGESGFVVDLVLFPDSLPAAIRLVEACPGTQFVLDHLGKPRIRERLMEPWASQIRELSLQPHVACKLSGLPTEADRKTWNASDLAPYVDHVLTTFGPQRLLYGSDWPVVNLAGGSSRWLDAATALLAHLTPDERAGVFAENASRIYRLGGT